MDSFFTTRKITLTRKTIHELININLKLSKIIENKSNAPEEIRLSHLLSMLQTAEYEINNYGSSNVQGIDLSCAPTSRRYGVNLKVTF